MSTIDRLKNLFLGINNQFGDGDSLTNERIMQMLVKHFETETKRKSVGKRLIYPMTFTIVLHKDDYDKHCDEFSLFMGEVVENFYELIRQLMRKYPNYINPAKYWKFRFVPSMLDNVELDGKHVEVHEGQPVILSSIYDVTERRSSSNSIQVSVTVGKSVTLKDVNVNLAAFENFSLNNEPIIIYWKDPLVKAEEDLSNDIPSALNPLFSTEGKSAKQNEGDVKGGKAPGFNPSFLKPSAQKQQDPKLAYKLNGKVFTHVISSGECYVCGNEASVGDKSVFKVQSDKVGNPHVLIRRDEKTNEWCIAAFVSKTKLGEKVLPVSTKDKLQWTPILVSENIAMNGFVVRFIKEN